jgi:hypothetical protein
MRQSLIILATVIIIALALIILCLLFSLCPTDDKPTPVTNTLSQYTYEEPESASTTQDETLPPELATNKITETAPIATPTTTDMVAPLATANDTTAPITESEPPVTTELTPTEIVTPPAPAEVVAKALPITTPATNSTTNQKKATRHQPPRTTSEKQVAIAEPAKQPPLLTSVLAQAMPEAVAATPVISTPTTTDTKAAIIANDIPTTESNPVSVSMSLDNSGNAATGQTRAGVTLSNGNLFNKGQAIALSYSTSTENPEQAQAISLGYQVPVFGLSDTLNLVIAHSDVTAATTSIPNGKLALTGSGNLASLHYNHTLPQQGDYQHQLIASIEQKDYSNNCIDGSCSATTGVISVQPIGIAYSGHWDKSDLQADVNLGVSHNVGGSSSAQFEQVLPNRNAQNDYTIQRVGVNILSVIGQSDWQWRVAAQAQRSDSALIAGEQIGLAGTSSLRGLTERQLVADSGSAVTAEIYTPDLSHSLGTNNGKLRLLTFIDSVNGQNNQSSATAVSQLSATSMGIGARYNDNRDWALKVDIAKLHSITATDANGNNDTALTHLDGDTRLHANLTMTF